MSGPVVVILAAGQGTRMRSQTPKLLHPVCGRPMIGWVVAAAKRAAASKIVVVDAPGEPLREQLDEDVITVIQEEPLGTAHALRAAEAHIDPDAAIVVLIADIPLIRPETIVALEQAREHAGAAATILTAVLEDPAGYGRVVRAADGTVERVVETKRPEDASPDELQIHEVNSAVYAFAGAQLLPALVRVGNDNAQSEYYLPDVLGIMRDQGQLVTAIEVEDVEETLGVNDRLQLAQVTAIAQRRINEDHMRGGATIVDPVGTVIDVDVRLGEDVVIRPGSALHGATSVGNGSTIGPHTTLIDVEVGESSNVIHSYAVGATVEDRVNVGPFAYLRPGAALRDGSKAGTFVEIKNSEVGARSKVPHLSYIGDTTIGEDTNIGASNITANYDGVAKHRTQIGSRVHTSVDTSFVAPVTVADDSYTAAGSVITRDVPEGALGVARSRQSNIEGYADRVRARREAPPSDPAGSKTGD